MKINYNNPYKGENFKKRMKYNVYEILYQFCLKVGTPSTNMVKKHEEISENLKTRKMQDANLGVHEKSKQQFKKCLSAIVSSESKEKSEEILFGIYNEMQKSYLEVFEIKETGDYYDKEGIIKIKGIDLK